jgi:hypothetical protein
MLTGGDSKTRFGVAFATAIFACVILSPVTGLAETQAETCDTMEDFGLDVLKLKSSGVSEADIQQGLNLAEDNPLYSMVTRIYSSDQVNAEYVLADARLQCMLLFFGAPDDGTRGSTGDQVDPSLTGEDWVKACTKDEWIKDLKKARGLATMTRQWDANEGQSNKLIAQLWVLKDKVADPRSDADSLLSDAGFKPSPFQSDILLAATRCVQTIIWKESDN